MTYDFVGPELVLAWSAAAGLQTSGGHRKFRRCLELGIEAWSGG